MVRDGLGELGVDACRGIRGVALGERGVEHPALLRRHPLVQHLGEHRVVEPVRPVVTDVEDPRPDRLGEGHPGFRHVGL